MNRKLVKFSAGQVPCPAKAIFHFQSQELKRVTLETSADGGLFFEGDCKSEKAVVTWFEAFVNGNHLPFPLQLEVGGGPFSARVLEALSKVPFGEVMTYGEIAAQLDNPRAARAVGNACNRNPFPLIIPCHRIVGSGGKMRGFAYGCSMKENLLDFEEQTIRKNRAL